MEEKKHMRNDYQNGVKDAFQVVFLVILVAGMVLLFCFVVTQDTPKCSKFDNSTFIQKKDCYTVSKDIWVCNLRKIK